MIWYDQIWYDMIRHDIAYLLISILFTIMSSSISFLLYFLFFYHYFSLLWYRFILFFFFFLPFYSVRSRAVSISSLSFLSSALKCVTGPPHTGRVLSKIQIEKKRENYEDNESETDTWRTYLPGRRKKRGEKSGAMYAILCCEF